MQNQFAAGARRRRGGQKSGRFKDEIVVREYPYPQWGH